jgi:hypothetical protein
MMIKKILPAAFLAIAAQFPFMAESEAAIFSLSWVGSGGYKLTGYFEYSGDSSSPNAADGVIRSGNNSGTNGNELTGMSVAFLDPTDTVLATYNLSQLLADTTFNFNFDIATQTVLQTGARNSDTGFYIGIFGNNSTDYSLSSTDASGGLSFTSGDFLNGPSDTNLTGTLTTQPIPFDFNPATGVVALGTLFATRKVWQKFRAKKDMV